MLFDLTSYNDASLLLLRIITAAVFLYSGWSHLTHPLERSKSIEMPPSLTAGLGLWELIGGASVLLGIYPQIGAIMLIGIMLGAIYKKIFRWHMPFFQDATNGWHYDLIFLIANLVVLTTGGGKWILT